MRYGIVGCGMMGQEHIRNLQLIEDAEITVIAEPDPGMQQRIRALLPRVKLVHTAEQLLATKAVDALVVATPNYQHCEQLLYLFKHCDLPILIEKPLVTELEQVDLIRKAAAKHPAPVWVGMEYRFMPPVVNFQQQLDQGAIGDLKMLHIREHRYPFLRKVNDWNRFNRYSGGTLVEKCCHFFDLMRLITRDEPVRVMASAGQDCNHLDESYDGERPDIIDNAFVIVDFASGKRALLDLSMFAEGSRFEQEITATGSQGKLECMIPGPSQLWKEKQATPIVTLSPRHPVGPISVDISIDETILAAGSHQGSTYYEHLGFKQAIEGSGAVQVTVEDGLKAVVMGMAAQYAAATGLPTDITEDGFDFSRMRVISDPPFGMPMN